MGLRPTKTIPESVWGAQVVGISQDLQTFKACAPPMSYLSSPCRPLKKSERVVNESSERRE